MSWKCRHYTQTDLISICVELFIGKTVTIGERNNFLHFREDLHYLLSLNYFIQEEMFMEDAAGKMVSSP